MTHDEMLSVLAAHSAAERAHDVAGTMRTMPDDCYQEHVAIGLRCEGQAACARYYDEALFTPFPDHGAERVVQAVGDDSIVLEVRLFGVMSGPWMGLPATGREFSFPMVCVVRFRDGLLLGETWYYDSVTVCDQLDLAHAEVLAAAARLSSAGGAT